MQAHTTTTARTNNFMPRLEKPDRIQLVKAYVKTVLNLSYYKYKYLFLDHIPVPIFFLQFVSEIYLS